MNQQHKQMIINTIDKFGVINTINIFGGYKNIIKKIYIDNPKQYLNHFNILNKKNINGHVVYEDNHNQIIIVIRKETNNCYINNQIIWLILNDVMNIKFTEIGGILKEWLQSSHDIITPSPRKLYDHYIKNNLTS